jgi:hypothetical protein
MSQSLIHCLVIQIDSTTLQPPAKEAAYTLLEVGEHRRFDSDKPVGFSVFRNRRTPAPLDAVEHSLCEGEWAIGADPEDSLNPVRAEPYDAFGQGLSAT